MHRLQVAVSVRACVCVGGGGFGVLAHCFSQGLWHLQQSRGLSFAGAICLLHALQAAAEQGLLQDPLPDWVRAGNELQGLVPALRSMHCPADEAALAAARERMAFQELFVLQLKLMVQRNRAW